jgi:2-phospho-L-lactate transferase CofD
MSTNRGIVVFSGGSAANNLVDVFNSVRESKKCPLSYIIPISDNGGSSSELIRVFGGPGIGDVRSMTAQPCTTKEMMSYDIIRSPRPSHTNTSEIH